MYIQARPAAAGSSSPNAMASVVTASMAPAVRRMAGTWGRSLRHPVVVRWATEARISNGMVAPSA